MLVWMTITKIWKNFNIKERISGLNLLTPSAGNTCRLKEKKARQLHSSQKIALTERRLSSEIILKAIERVTKLD
jgi:hypothetical protein